MTKRKIIISNGLKNFHLSSAAAEADKRGALHSFFCGVYPVRWGMAILALLRIFNPRAASKLEGRRASIDPFRINMFALPDLFGDLGIYFEKMGLQNLADSTQGFSMRLFAISVRRGLRKSIRPGTIYHYRAGFGLSSLEKARELGCTLLCDHSIAHPALLDSYIVNNGLPGKPTQSDKMNPLWRHVQRDIELADHILVNSDFVKSTFTLMGVPSGKISVIYQGLDDAFLNIIPKREPKARECITFLFAGRFGARKGAALIVAALKKLSPGNWRFLIAGTIDPIFVGEVRELEKAGSVKFLGNLSRDELAGVMCDADVFVFPTLAEGSARVIFEAMACGCYIITTPNAGSVVKSVINGVLIPPGEISSLLGAMVFALNDSNIRSIGENNSILIGDYYSQEKYGSNLMLLYEQLSKSDKE